MMSTTKTRTSLFVAAVAVAAALATACAGAVPGTATTSPQPVTVTQTAAPTTVTQAPRTVTQAPTTVIQPPAPTTVAPLPLDTSVPAVPSTPASMLPQYPVTQGTTADELAIVQIIMNPANNNNWGSDGTSTLHPTAAACEINTEDSADNPYQFNCDITFSEGFGISYWVSYTVDHSSYVAVRRTH